MSLDIISSLDLFDLHLFGGGRDAQVLAERLGSVWLCIHANSVSGGLMGLSSRLGWARDERTPVPQKGQCWLIATGDEECDAQLVAAAESAEIALYVPRWPERCTIHLPVMVKAAPEDDQRQPTLGCKGHVSLVGAGPGDPELLTLKALAALRNADVLIYDRLVSDEVLAFVPAEARRFYVGKARSSHSVPQDGINQALVEWAQQGYRVVRLKGGDPFMFGRGGEELETLAAAGIEFDVIPGITAALGVSSYAGIPLTHRDHAQSVRFVTGHLKNGSVDLDWPTLASPGQTLVFYMGLGSLDQITRQLMAHGASADTPIALVEQGTTARQRVHVGQLGDIVAQVAELSIAPPTLIIVGGVVSLYTSLGWFDHARASSLGWRNGKHPTPLQQVDQR